MEKEEEVFVDAKEEVTPRRSGRKKRSTAGSASAASCKKSRPTTSWAMPTKRSPGTAPNGAATKKGVGERPCQPPESTLDPDAF